MTTGEHCQVLIKRHFKKSLGGYVEQRNYWKDGVLVSMGAKRAKVDIGDKIIEKRLQFIKPI